MFLLRQQGLEARNAILCIPIEDIGLSNRACNAFCRGFIYKHGYNMIDELRLITVNDLYREFTGKHNDIAAWRGVGNKTYMEYEIILNELGLL